MRFSEAEDVKNSRKKFSVFGNFLEKGYFVGSDFFSFLGFSGMEIIANEYTKSSSKS